jgi:cell division protein FtsB
MQKAIITIISLAILFGLGSQVYRLQKERISISKEYEEIEQTHDELEADNKEMADKMEYLSEPLNLEKELRSKFNYTHPGEELIIVVPNEGGVE